MSPGVAPLRCVILDTGDVDRPTLRAAAEFARLLRLEILGVFIEDPSLLALASLPFARELRMPEYGWQALMPQRLDEELRVAGLRARERFREEIELRGLPGRFEVRRGDPATLTEAVAQPSDVLIVAAEPQAAGAFAPAHALVRRAALASAASLLLLPQTGMAGPGPVAAVVDSEAGPCFELASRIAAATGEVAIAVPRMDDSSSAALSASLAQALGPRGERLLVVPRELAALDALLSVAAERRIPVLLVAD